MLHCGLPIHQATPISETNMVKKRNTKEAKIKAFRDHESGRSQAEFCKELNIAAQKFYRWKRQFGMITNPEVRRLKQLENKKRSSSICWPTGRSGSASSRSSSINTLSPWSLRNCYQQSWRVRHDRSGSPGRSSDCGGTRPVTASFGWCGMRA
jgi:putative transposase